VVEAERVVVCTGYWATDFLRSFGLDLTIRPQALYSAITGPALDGQHVPLTLDLDTGFVVEREATGLIIAILFEVNPAGYGHTRMLEEFAELARVRAPSLCGQRRGWSVDGRGLRRPRSHARTAGGGAAGQDDRGPA
jgi:glycine/D-amino acid oxidase-like deaminating enzyme